MKLRLTIDDLDVEAVLDWGRAPQGAGLLYSALPLTTEWRHSAWSGACVVARFEHLRRPIVTENQVSFMFPGSIIYCPETGEIALSYGQAQWRDASGNKWVSHVGDVVGETQPLFSALKAARTGGPRQISITRHEEFI